MATWKSKIFTKHKDGVTYHQKSIYINVFISEEGKMLDTIEFNTTTLSASRVKKIMAQIMQDLYPEPPS